MDGTEFEPGEPGQGVLIPQRRGRASENEERRRAGTPPTLEAHIGETLYVTDDTSKLWQQQAYPIRLLKQRYGLSHNYAAFVAAELRWGGA